MAIYLLLDAYGMLVATTNAAADTLVEMMLRLCPQIKLVRVYQELWEIHCCYQINACERVESRVPLGHGGTVKVRKRFVGAKPHTSL